MRLVSTHIKYPFTVNLDVKYIKTKLKLRTSTSPIPS